jgi:hypothetical protein
VIVWTANLPEIYCVDSGLSVIREGDRCRSHGARGEMCTTARRPIPKCRHDHLSPNHPYPRCSECGANGEALE